MSEETRRNRAVAIAEVNAQIDLHYDKIAELESRIEELRYSIPPELPEDYAWRLEQMSPTERKLHEITTRHLAEACQRLIKDFERYKTDNAFAQDGKLTYLRIRLPDDYTIATPKDPS